MMKFASEKAMALVDGQLAPAEAPAVIQEIAHTPALMRLVQKYLAVNPWKIRQLYRDLEQEPVPDRLTDAVLYSPMGEVRRSSPGFVEKLAALAARTREKYMVPGWSLAAGPAMAGALVAVSAYTFMPTSSVGAYADAGVMVPPLEFDCIEHATGGHPAVSVSKQIRRTLPHARGELRRQARILCRCLPQSDWQLANDDGDQTRSGRRSR